jgi:hypothetical protein
MNETAKGALIGLLSGLSVAIGGAIKDAPYEGFDILKFLRSPAIGTVEGGIAGKLVPRTNPIILYFTIIGTEHATTEGYKLLRAKMPMKFKYGEYGIPKRNART